MNLRFPELVRGASAAFLWKAAARVLGFGVHLLVARLLGAGGAGLYYLALAIVTLATVLGRAGLDMRFSASWQPRYRAAIGIRPPCSRAGAFR